MNYYRHISPHSRILRSSDGVTLYQFGNMTKWHATADKYAIISDIYATIINDIDTRLRIVGAFIRDNSYYIHCTYGTPNSTIKPFIEIVISSDDIGIQINTDNDNTYTILFVDYDVFLEMLDNITSYINK